MAFTIRSNEKIAVAREATDAEGTYVEPTEEQFITPLEDGIELNPAKELLDRSILTPNIGRALPRTGTRSVAGTIGIEAKANGTEGAAPEQGLLIEAALGSEKLEDLIDLPSQAFADEAVTFTFTSGDNFEVNDIVVIQFAGAYHITPITGISGTTATFLIPIEGAKTAAVYTVAAYCKYEAANEGHPSLSITKEVESDLVEKALGCRVGSMALENFTTGQLATHSFGIEGLTYDWTTGGVDITDTASIGYTEGSAVDGSTALQVSIDGAAAVRLAYEDTNPDASSNQFGTIAELVALLDGLTGLSATINADTATQIDLISTQKEDGTILITVDTAGNAAFSPTTDINLTADPSFDESLPPVILNACVFQNDLRIDVNELAFSVENTLGFITSTCSPNGRTSSRVTARATTGSFNPYKLASVDGDLTEAEVLAQFNLFNNNTEYSLFAYAANPSSTPGEFEDVIAYYLPSCLTTELAEGEADGVLQNNISFSASAGAQGDQPDVIVAFI